MSTIPTIEPFRTELEYERSGRSGRGASMGSRGGQAPRLPRPSKPPSAKPPYSPAWRRRRDRRVGVFFAGPALREPGARPERSQRRTESQPVRAVRNMSAGCRIRSIARSACRLRSMGS